MGNPPKRSSFAGLGSSRQNPAYAPPFVATPSDPSSRLTLAGQCRRLLDLSESVLTLSSPQEAARQVLDTLFEALPSDALAIFLYDRRARKLQPFEILHSRIYAGCLMGYRGNGALGRVYHSGKPELARFSGEPGQRDEYLLAVPVKTGKRNLGVLAAARNGPPPFNHEELDLAEAFAGYASLAVENAEFVRDNQSDAALIARLMPFIRDLSRPMSISELTQVTGEGALALSGANHIAVYGYENEDQETRFWSRGLTPDFLSRMLGQFNLMVEENNSPGGKPVFTADVRRLPVDSLRRDLVEREGFRAIAACPVVFDGRLMAMVDCFYDQPHEWSEIERSVLETFIIQAAMAFENVHLYADLEATYMETVLTLARAVDARDSYTAAHSQRLAEWAVATAKKLNLSREEIQTIRWAALLHDIGKIGVPDAILCKPGPLTDEEWAVMKRHPEVGAEIISPVRRLSHVTSLVRSHQEKFDGSGYPDGLKGEQIPLGARIITVVDAFGAMTDERVYRQACTRAEAAAELKRCAGKHFDRQVVDVFYQVISPSI